MTDDDVPPWIERVVSILGNLGANRVRVRWKLIRWHNARRKGARRREQAIAHVKYEHAVCPQCKAVNARDEQVCTRCGTPMHGRAREVLGRLGLGALSTTIVIALVIVGCYVRTALAGHDWISIPTGVLIRHGANLPRGAADDEWWRYLTATLLHVGLWHIAFNLLALAVVGPHVERNYGRLAMAFVFVSTGMLASIGSQLTGMWGAGASGAIMGMIGAIAGAGQRSGTTLGKQERNAMLRWAVYTIIFGIGVGADNHAHVAGFVVGAGFGLLVPTEARTPRWVKRTLAVLGALSIAAILGAAALVMWPPAGAATRVGGTYNEASTLVGDIASCKMGRELDDGRGVPSSVEDACAHVAAVHAFCTGELPAFFATATPIECQMMRAVEQPLQVDPRAGRGQ